MRNPVSYLDQRKGKVGKYTGHARNYCPVPTYVEHPISPHGGKKEFVQAQTGGLPVRQLLQEQEHLLTLTPHRFPAWRKSTCHPGVQADPHQGGQFIPPSAFP